jgi:hypothetical protein
LPGQHASLHSFDDGVCDGFVDVELCCRFCHFDLQVKSLGQKALFGFVIRTSSERRQRLKHGTLLQTIRNQALYIECRNCMRGQTMQVEDLMDFMRRSATVRDVVARVRC